MQPGPTSPPPPDATEAVVDSPAADAAEGEVEVEAQPEVKVEPPPPVQEEEAEEAEEPRKGGRRRKRARRGVPTPASSPAAAEPAPTPTPPAPGVGRGSVMVKRDLLARCLTCPLCNRLLRDATTISECLHTFCRKCIYEKFNDEEVECCPVCKRNLGCTPVEKLRT